GSIPVCSVRSARHVRTCDGLQNLRLQSGTLDGHLVREAAGLELHVARGKERQDLRLHLIDELTVPCMLARVPTDRHVHRLPFRLNRMGIAFRGRGARAGRTCLTLPGTARVSWDLAYSPSGAASCRTCGRRAGAARCGPYPPNLD